MGVSGLIISIVEWIYPHKFSTILEVDFDTPYDRHIIIEDSHDTRKRRFKIPRLEEPLNAGLTAGSRLLRRLSKRGGNKETASNEVQTNPGFDNHGFELEMPPKSKWKSSLLMRTDSKKSNKSVNFRGSQRSEVFLDIPDLKGDDKPKIFQRDSRQSSSIFEGKNNSTKEINSNPDMKRQDSCQSCSSASSLGLGMLSRNSSVRKVSNEENNHTPVTRNNSGNIIVFHRTDSRGQLQR